MKLYRDILEFKLSSNKSQEVLGRCWYYRNKHLNTYLCIHRSKSNKLRWGSSILGSPPRFLFFSPPDFISATVIELSKFSARQSKRLLYCESCGYILKLASICSESSTSFGHPTRWIHSARPRPRVSREMPSLIYVENQLIVNIGNALKLPQLMEMLQKDLQDSHLSTARKLASNPVGSMWASN